MISKFVGKRAASFLEKVCVLGIFIFYWNIILSEKMQLFFSFIFTYRNITQINILKRE